MSFPGILFYFDLCPLPLPGTTEDSGSNPFTCSYGVFLYTGDISPEPSLFQAMQPQLTQCLLI